MDEHVPLKLIELSDFLRCPSVLSSRIRLADEKKNDKKADCSSSNNFHTRRIDPTTSRSETRGVVLLSQQCLEQNNGQRERQLLIGQDVMVFADEIDRKKIGLANKSSQVFSRHLLINSGAALQALIPALTQAKEWIIVCKLRYFKRYGKVSSIQRNVLISLNVQHPFVRYELLSALDLLQQTFNEIQSASIVINFSSLLKRWFKIYLRQTEQYPSMSARLLYRYEIQTSKSLLTLGKRQCHDDEHQSTLLKSLHKFASMHKCHPPIEISIDFNSLPTIIYSIQFDHVLAYSIDQQDKYVSADVGHGLVLLSVTHLVDAWQGTWKCLASPATCSSTLLKKHSDVVERSSSRVEESEAKDSPSLLMEINEEERVLFDQISKNRLRIQMQHQHLLNRAAQSNCFSSIDRSSVVAQAMY